VSADRIRRVLAAKVRQHPELARPLTWNTLRRVLRREDVELVVAPLPKPARLVGFGGLWTIAVSSRHPTRRHTYFAAHELGHLWLHVDDADGRHTRCYNFDDYTSPDPREDEAETVATWLLGDPEVRAFLNISEPATAVLPALATLPLQAAMRGRQIIRAHELAPKAPAPPAEPERVRIMRQRIDDVDDFDALLRVRREIQIAFDRDPWMRALLDLIQRREDELLEERVAASRRRSSSAQ
jgi:hypothetical protein